MTRRAAKLQKYCQGEVEYRLWLRLNRQPINRQPRWVLARVDKSRIERIYGTVDCAVKDGTLDLRLWRNWLCSGCAKAMGYVW